MAVAFDAIHEVSEAEEMAGRLERRTNYMLRKWGCVFFHEGAAAFLVVLAVDAGVDHLAELAVES
ncbi:MAG: hypothetical protein OXP69_01745 [Spirochaetaceae bacterium]|nr:hypothetical protein [Spirochaetaceae bacterium]